MNRLKILCITGVLACSAALAQLPAPEKDVKLPSGKSQREEILKHEHAKSLEDAEVLVRLTQELKDELERDDRHILSIATLKKTEEIEKLAKRIRTRMKRF